MADGKTQVKIAKPADEVWDLVGDFGGLGNWMPGVDSCVLDGDVRVLQTMGLEIHEQLKEHDDDARKRPRERETIPGAETDATPDRASHGHEHPSHGLRSRNAY